MLDDAAGPDEIHNSRSGSARDAPRVLECVPRGSDCPVVSVDHPDVRIAHIRGSTLAEGRVTSATSTTWQGEARLRLGVVPQLGRPKGRPALAPNRLAPAPSSSREGRCSAAAARLVSTSVLRTGDLVMSASLRLARVEGLRAIRRTARPDLGVGVPRRMRRITRRSGRFARNSSRWLRAGTRGTWQRAALRRIASNDRAQGCRLALEARLPG